MRREIAIAMHISVKGLKKTKISSRHYLMGFFFHFVKLLLLFISLCAVFFPVKWTMRIINHLVCGLAQQIVCYQEGRNEMTVSEMAVLVSRSLPCSLLSEHGLLGVKFTDTFISHVLCGTISVFSDRRLCDQDFLIAVHHLQHTAWC